MSKVIASIGLMGVALYLYTDYKINSYITNRLVSDVHPDWKKFDRKKRKKVFKEVKKVWSSLHTWGNRGIADHAFTEYLDHVRKELYIEDYNYGLSYSNFIEAKEGWNK